MRRYFKPKGTYFDTFSTYLGEILNDDGSIMEINSDRMDPLVFEGQFCRASIEEYVKLGRLEEITKEEAALLFGFV